MHIGRAFLLAMTNVSKLRLPPRDCFRKLPASGRRSLLTEHRLPWKLRRANKLCKFGKHATKRFRPRRPRHFGSKITKRPTLRLERGEFALLVELAEAEAERLRWLELARVNGASPGD